MMLVAPVLGKIVDAGLYTGRPPSFARENCALLFRFRSCEPVWLMPYASDPSTLKLYRSKKRRLAPSDARHTLGALKPFSKVVTLRRDPISGLVPPVPSAHCVGMVVGSDRYDDQSGIGTAAPMHVSVDW